MAVAQQPASVNRLHYGWIVAGVTFLVLLAAAGVRSAPSVFIVPIETEFGWTRATVSAAVAINLLLYGLLGPFAAAFMDRIGLRATAIIALGTMAAGLLGTLVMTASGQLLLLWGVVIGTGSGVASLVIGAVVANRWFVARRGLIMGLLTASVAAGQLIFLPMLARIVTDYSWRWAVIVVTAITLAVIPIAALLLRDHPRDVGIKPYGAPAGFEDTPAAAPTNPFAQAMSSLGDGIGSRDFWLLSLSLWVCGASTNGIIGTHLIPFCIESGVPADTAAGMLAIIGIFNLVGTTGSGWLTDRFDSRYLLFWYYLLRGISLLFLPYIFDLSFFGLSVFTVFYGLDWMATVPPTVRLIANSFGANRAGMMFGWIMVIHQVGSATAAAGAGMLHDTLGNYTGSFLIAGALCFIASVAVLPVGRRPRRGRPIEAAPAGASA
jgi:MFS family permease